MTWLLAAVMLAAGEPSLEPTPVTSMQTQEPVWLLTWWIPNYGPAVTYWSGDIGMWEQEGRTYIGVAGVSCEEGEYDDWEPHWEIPYDIYPYELRIEQNGRAWWSIAWDAELMRVALVGYRPILHPQGVVECPVP